MMTGQATLRVEFNAGILAGRFVKDMENYGKSLGLHVEVFQSGWLVRHGFLVATGPEEECRRLSDYCDRLQEAAAS